MNNYSGFLSGWMKLDEEVTKLTNFILDEIPDEPHENESAVDCAIRVIRRQRDTLKVVYDLLRMTGREWQENYPGIEQSLVCDLVMIELYGKRGE